MMSTMPPQIGWLVATLILTVTAITTGSVPFGLAAITVAIIFHAVVTQ